MYLYVDPSFGGEDNFIVFDDNNIIKTRSISIKDGFKFDSELVKFVGYNIFDITKIYSDCPSKYFLPQVKENLYKNQKIELHSICPKICKKWLKENNKW